MPLQLTKKPDDPAVVAPSWHPNFRNFDKLPDIKVVKTMLYLNIALGCVLLMVASYVGYQEYAIWSVSRKIDHASAVIQKNKAASDRAIADFRKFQEQEKRLSDLEAFMRSRPHLSELLMHLGSTLPPNIAFSSFELREQVLTIRSVVRGSPEAASGTARQYVERLREDRIMQGLFSEIQLTNMSRSPATGRLNVEFVFGLKPVKK